MDGPQVGGSSRNTWQEYRQQAAARTAVLLSAFTYVRTCVCVRACVYVYMLVASKRVLTGAGSISGSNKYLNTPSTQRVFYLRTAVSDGVLNCLSLYRLETQRDHLCKIKIQD